MSSGYEKTPQVTSDDPLLDTKFDFEQEDTDDSNMKAKPAFFQTPCLRDSLVLAGILIMLTWPWIFFVVVAMNQGIAMRGSLVRLVVDHPQDTTFFVTLIGTGVSLILSTLFSLSALRFSQGWLAKGSLITVFQVTILAAFRQKTLPWGLKDRKFLLSRKRWLVVALAAGYIGAVAVITSSTASLVAPVHFNRTVLLNTKELDFASTSSDCLNWFNANPISNNCSWETFEGLTFTTCLDSTDVVDLLEAGRGQIHSLLFNKGETLTFTQISNQDNLHFLGPIRGVLPSGPNGVPTLYVPDNSPFSDAPGAVLSYNYTFDHQGLQADVDCNYEMQSPITDQPLTPNTTLAVAYSANCTEIGLADVLEDVTFLPAINSWNLLLYWACKSPPGDGRTPSYFIYLRGKNDYQSAIGNITCIISPMQPALFPTTYQSATGVFSAGAQTGFSTNTFPGLTSSLLVGLGGLFAYSQNWEANQVAETIITYGTKFSGLQPYQQNPEYLRLYEAMIQGILEYEASYIRLVYSVANSTPPSCARTMNGSLVYETIGWFAPHGRILFLLPLTIINLAALGLLLMALRMPRGDARTFDPTDPRQLIYASHNPDGGDPDGWEDTVVYHPQNVGERMDETESPA